MKSFILILAMLSCGILYAQDDSIIFKSDFGCYSNCLDECEEICAYVEIGKWSKESMYVHINLDTISNDVNRCRNFDVENYSIGNGVIYLELYDNKYNAKWIHISDSTVYLSHKHNLLKSHTIIYHNNK